MMRSAEAVFAYTTIGRVRRLTSRNDRSSAFVVRIFVWSSSGNYPTFIDATSTG